jgi:raffinose/stachyose/melibiose transport system permease protein
MRRYTRRTFVLELGMLAFAFGVFLFPIYVLFITAFKPESEATRAIELPRSPTLANFGNAVKMADVPDATLNSLIVVVASVLILVVCSSLASYPLARITTRWSQLFYYMFMFGLVMPFQLALIPLYATMRDWHLLGSPISLILLYAGLLAPLSVFMFTEFLRGVPRDYEEAATIDGGNRLQIFIYVVVPLLRPIIGTVAILTAIIVWNDFFAPLLYVSGSGNETLPVKLFQFTGQYSQRWNLIFAALILGSAPLVGAFLVMQRAVFKGYATGIKG